MPNWGASMQQTFEYYTVDPGTWRDDQRITTATKSVVERDSESETLGSASIEATESLGECYVVFISLQFKMEKERSIR